MNMPKIGRPSKYTDALAKSICERIIGGESLRRICKDKSMPCRRTVASWLLDPDKEAFLHQYETASNIRADEKFEEMEEISENEKIDVNRARLIIDTRKWFLSKIMPKKYGDRIDIDHSGSVNIQRVTFEN